MELTTAAVTLSALAHEGRLAAFRLMVQAGPEGLAAGEIARRLGAPPSSLSSNLAILTGAGLAVPRRQGRSIRYAADYGRMTSLLAFLVRDCCDGSPEVCAPLIQVVQQAACCAAATPA